MLAIALALSLVCMGGGTIVKPDSIPVSGTVSDPYGGGTTGTFTGSIGTTRTESYSDQVDVELIGNAGRIRLPRVVLPIAHGGQGGWFEFRNLTITDRAVDASAAVNFVDKPKVHIDRLTGSISITGRHGTFVGTCDPVDPASQRKF